MLRILGELYTGSPSTGFTAEYSWSHANGEIDAGSPSMDSTPDMIFLEQQQSFVNVALTDDDVDGQTFGQGCSSNLE